MKNKLKKRGMTLVEILMAVVILLTLITLTVKVGGRIDQRAKERLTTETINLVEAALGEFLDFDYEYKDQKYAALKFPLDCNDFSDSQIRNELITALGYSSISIVTTSHLDKYSGCEAMYFILNMVPQSRAVLDEIDQSLILKSGTITINNNSNQVQPLLRIVDAWRTTLHYSYYDNDNPVENQPSDRGNSDKLDEPPITEPRGVPVVTSAGQDKEFGTEDDITSR